MDERPTESVLVALKSGLDERGLDHGKKTFAAATCIVCHRVRDEGGTVGPRLMGIGARFTLRDIVEAITEPNKAVSEQYGMVQIVRTRKTARVEIHKARHEALETTCTRGYLRYGAHLVRSPAGRGDG